MLYIVRHGQTDWNLENRIQGSVDISLNETGRVHAHDVAQKLQNFKIQKIVSSDLSRASETAKIIGGHLNMAVDYDARLREYDFGRLTGMYRAGIEPEMVEAFFSNPTEFEAEHMKDAFTRVRSFFDTVDYNKNTLIVTHGGIINFMMCYMEDKNTFRNHSFLDKCLHSHIGNAAILRIKDMESGISMLRNTRFFRLPQSK